MTTPESLYGEAPAMGVTYRVNGPGGAWEVRLNGRAIGGTYFTRAGWIAQRDLDRCRMDAPVFAERWQAAAWLVEQARGEVGHGG